jgi:acetylglutamate kinase
MMKREDVLMEALPYIQQFHGKTIVIKLGGHAMVDPVVLENAIRDAVLLHYVGIRVVLVHGGGPEISEKMKAMGKESVFVGGLRVTDQETLEIAQMVLVGKINKGIVSLIAKCGARGVGLSGSDGNLIIAKKMDLQRVDVGGVQQEIDLGHVGEIECIDPAILNINADTAAGDIAIALKSYKLVNMTDVDGVMDSNRTKVFRKLSIGEAISLQKSGAIGEGMIPKVSSIIKAVENGVCYAHIINGNIEHNLILELFTRDGVGTMISLK